MKAMILCAGLGTRLGEVTQEVPKPLVKVGSKPMLQWVIEKLKDAGVSSIVINLHHLAEQVRDFLENNNYFDLTIEFSYEEKLLGTGGGLRKVREFFSAESSFLLHNADVYSEIDLLELKTAHVKSKALATVAVVKPSSSRYLIFDEEDNLIGWENREEGKQKIIKSSKSQINLDLTGVHIISSRIFEYMNTYADDEPFSIVTPYIEAASQGELIRAYNIGDVYWIDAGTPENLNELRTKLNIEIKS